MLKKLISLVNQRPDLLADYVSEYTVLMREAVMRSRRRYARRAIWLLLSLMLVNASLIVGALALMLWINMPELGLVNIMMIPMVLGVLTVVAVLLLIFDSEKYSEFSRINEQLQQDSKILMLLREPHE
jgi:ABC-type uncharacterized transport system YnjBCD permease subunit